MTKKQILQNIRRHCKECPLRCSDECPLFKFKDGIDTTKEKRVLSQASLDNLMKSSRRNGGAA